MAKKFFINVEKDAIHREPNAWDKFVSKLPWLIAAVAITALLYMQMDNKQANPIVLIYFSFLGLTFWEVVGLPVSKLADLLKNLRQ